MQAAAAAAIADAGVGAGELDAIGITNQRETTIVWERRTGRPIERAIVWQDRRTAERCRELPAALVRERTGLVPDPYFSATKLEWLLARTSTRQDELAFGTVDAWLLWKLTGGRVHATDVTNASRTMLLDLRTLDWDDELLALFGVERSLLPRIVPSSGVAGEGELLGVTLPVAGIAGDQQAALFGQACFAPGQAKATYGTGSFVLVNVGDSLELAPEGLLKSAAAVAPGAEPQYAVEGAVLASGAAVQWLRDGLGLIGDAAETEALARSVDSTDGVVFVPALAGLGSPHWAPDARGLISGLTRGTTRAHLARATLEAIAFQVDDVLGALPARHRRAPRGRRRDRQRLPDAVPGRPARLPGRGRRRAGDDCARRRRTGRARGRRLVGLDEVRRLVRPGVRYEPALGRDEAAQLREGWQLAVQRALLRG